MIAPRGRCLDYSKVYSDATERWLLAKTNKLHITYFYKSTDVLPANKHN